MEKFRKQIERVMHLPLWSIVINMIVSYPLVIYTLCNSDTNQYIVYFSYVFSAYTTVVVCVNLPRTVRLVKRCIYGDEIRFIVWIRKKLLSNTVTYRYLKDAEYRAKISLYTGLFVNILFGIFKGTTGYLFRSAWLLAIGLYYITLAFVRFVLLRNVKVTEREAQTEQRKRKEWKRYHTCGIMLLFLDISMAGMVVQMVWQDKSNIYPGWTIYASAIYTFYYFITAMASMIKFFHWKNAIVSAAKNVTLAGAAMSVLMLQTAMISTFGEIGESSRMMNGITGAIVSAFCIGLAVFMIIWSNYHLKKFKIEK